MLSDDIAFRVHFEGAIPAQHDRYWRGPVLELFNGRLWRRSDRTVYAGAEQAAAPAAAPLYGYTIGLEPYPHNWIYSLDRPVHWDLARARLSDSGVLERTDPVSQPIDITMISIAGATTPGALQGYQRTRDLALPPQRNPRTALLAQQMRAAHPDERDYVRSVLSMLHDQAFFYTLTPPRLGENSVDDFLFDSRRGFCGHYASAFAVMMRAAGIPARVVTGYLGGMENPYGHYWVIRQSDAHAWVEVWIAGIGWSRIDPTAAIASNRMQFDQGAQQSLLQRLMIPLPDAGKYAVLVALCVCFGFGWMSWRVHRDAGAPAHDPLARALQRLCDRVEKIGVHRMPYEGAEAFAERVARARPDLAPAIRAVVRQYSDVRYGADAGNRAAAAQLMRAMRRFSVSRES